MDLVSTGSCYLVC